MQRTCGPPPASVGRVRRKTRMAAVRRRIQSASSGTPVLVLSRGVKILGCLVDEPRTHLYGYVREACRVDAAYGDTTGL